MASQKKLYLFIVNISNFLILSLFIFNLILIFYIQNKLEIVSDDLKFEYEIIIKILIIVTFFNFLILFLSQNYKKKILLLFSSFMFGLLIIEIAINSLNLRFESDLDVIRENIRKIKITERSLNKY